MQRSMLFPKNLGWYLDDCACFALCTGDELGNYSKADDEQRSYFQITSGTNLSEFQTHPFNSDVTAPCLCLTVSQILHV